MKIKKCFKMKKIFGSVVMTPVGMQGSTVSGIIRLNKAGYDIWQWIDQGLETEEIYPLYAEKYKFDAVKAKNDVDSLIGQFRTAGVFEPEEDWTKKNLKDLK